MYIQENDPWVFEEEPLEDYYFSPRFEIRGNNIVNVVETRFVIKRTFLPSTRVNVPLFFSTTEYARFGQYTNIGHPRS